MTNIQTHTPGSHGEFAHRPMAWGTHGMVGGGTQFTAQTGMQVLFAGGNAVDAAVASALAAGVLACTLACSLSHLAEAIKHITRSCRWLSWALAVAFDVALVCSELTITLAADAGIGMIAWAVMIGVGLLSCMLNVYAFFHTR